MPEQTLEADVRKCFTLIEYLALGLDYALAADAAQDRGDLETYRLNNEKARQTVTEVLRGLDKVRPPHLEA